MKDLFTSKPSFYGPSLEWYWRRGLAMVIFLIIPLFVGGLVWRWLA